MIDQSEDLTAEAPLDPLVADLIASLAEGPRPYRDVMEAWRTSCPHLTVWEDAVDLGLIRRCPGEPGTGDMVAMTERGRAALARRQAGLDGS